MKIHRQSGLPTQAMFPDEAKARSTDPETSHAAARSASRELRLSQITVLKMFACSRELTDEDLIAELSSRKIKMSDSGARSRRKELADAGHLEVCGKRPLKSGNNGSVYRATDRGNQYLEEVQW